MDKIKKSINYILMFVLMFLAIFSPFLIIMKNGEEIYIDKIGSYNDLIEMPDVLFNDWVEYLVKSFLENDISYIENHTHYFEEDAYEKIINSIENVKPIGIRTTNNDNFNGNLRNIVVEQSKTYSSIIVMCNFIIDHPETNFSGVYLLELHINYSGRIFGFNLWQY